MLFPAFGSPTRPTSAITLSSRTTSREAHREIGSEADVFLTGGWRWIVQDEFSDAQEFPELVLSGIGIAAMRMSGL